MSAFLVEKKTIDRMVTAIKRGLMGSDNGFYTRLLDEMGFTPPFDDDFTTMGRLFYELNEYSLMMRYKGENSRAASGSYEFKSLPFDDVSMRKIQVIKTLDCYLYQSCEGFCPDALIYKAVERWREWLVNTIITASADYENADWA